MRHTEVKKLAEKIGNHAQEVAESAQRLADEIDAADAYEDTDSWVDEITLLGEEFVAELDILAKDSAEARDSIAAGISDGAVV